MSSPDPTASASKQEAQLSNMFLEAAAPVDDVDALLPASAAGPANPASSSTELVVHTGNALVTIEKVLVILDKKRSFADAQIDLMKTPKWQGTVLMESNEWVLSHFVHKLQYTRPGNHERQLQLLSNSSPYDFLFNLTNYSEKLLANATLDSEPLRFSFVKWAFDLFNEPRAQAFLDALSTLESSSYQILINELKKVLHKIKGGLSHRDSDSRTVVELANAFKCEFLNPPDGGPLKSVSETFNQYLQEAIQQTAGSQVYLSYTSIVQSSGWGKSRAAVEYCKQHNIPCLYLCLRNPAHSGFPARSIYAETILSQLRLNGTGFAARLFRYAIYCAFTDEFFVDKQNLVSWHNSDLFWKFVLEMMARNQVDLSDDQIDEFIESQRTVHDIKNCGSPINALFVFDEARELLPVEILESNSFFATRRALFENRASVQRLKLFVVYMDTHSKMANFSPSKHADSNSARMIDYELQNPFIAVSNHPWLFAVDRKLNREHPYDPRFFGRPLWKTTLDAKYTMIQILDFAVRKLICSRSPFSELPKGDKYNASLAVICCCLGMSVVPSSEKSSTLVASHMATCIGISKDRSRAYSKYPSEPFLNMAALKLLHENTDEILEHARRAFAQSDLGDSGETVAQLMCLLAAKKPAFDSVRDGGREFGAPESINMMNTPLHQFLKKFFDADLCPVPVRRSARIANLAAKSTAAPSVQPLSTASAVDDVTRGLAGINLQGTFDSTGRIPAHAAAAANAAGDASVNSEYSARLLRFFHVDCTAADIRLTHFKRLTRLPTVGELPFLFDIGAAMLLPPGNPGTDLAIVVRLCIGGVFRYSLIAIQVKNIITSITSATLPLLFDLMNDESLLLSPLSELNQQCLTASAVSVPKKSSSTSSRSAKHDQARTSSMSADASQRLDLPFLRIVMKTRMSLAESNYEDLCFLKLDSPGERDQGTGIVRGFPLWLTEQQQDTLNGMLCDLDSRSQLPAHICDHDLMKPWFDSMHDSAGMLQENEIRRRCR